MGETSFVDKAIMAFTKTLSRLPARLIRFRWLVLTCFVGFSGLCAHGVSGLVIDQGLDQWFDEDDKTLQIYQVFRRVFGGDSRVIVLYEPKNGDVFSEDSLERVRKLEDRLNTLRTQPGSNLGRLIEVQSLLSVDVLEGEGDTLYSRPLVGNALPTTQQERDALRKRARATRDLEGSLFSSDFKYGIMVLRTDFNARLVQEETQDGLADVSDAGDFDEDSMDFDFDEDADEGVIAFTDQDVGNLESVQIDGYVTFMTALRAVLDDEGWHTINSPASTERHVKTYLAGEPPNQEFFQTQLFPEFNKIGLLSMTVIIIALYLAFGSASYVLWPLLIVGLSLIWTLGTVALLGVKVTMLVNVVAMLNLAVGVASSVHILNAYQLGLKEGLDWNKALGRAYGTAGFPVVLALTTTLAGLLSLTSVPLAPMRAFGLYASLGVFLAMVGTIFLLPVLMSFWCKRTPPKSGSPIRYVVDDQLQALLMKVSAISRQRTGLTLGVFIVVSMFAGYGVSLVKIDTNYTQVVKDGYGKSEVVRLIDQLFGGTSNLEVILDTGAADGAKAPEVLHAMDKFVKLSLEGGSEFINRSFSLVKLTKESYQRLTDDSPENYKIPEGAAAVAQTLSLYESADPENRKLFVDDNWQIARVTFSGYSKGSSAYKVFMKDLDGWLEESFGPLREKYPNLKWHVSGNISLIMHFANLFTEAQISSFGIALGVICLIVLVAFGSLKFGLLAMIPNLFPIFILVSAAGWIGFPFDADTLIVIPIAIGIAVDDTIHFLSHYRTKLLEGMSQDEAIETTVQEVGQAMTYTTVILVLSFLTYTFLLYKPMTAFGVLSSISIAAALIADLFIIPILLRYFKPFAAKEEILCSQQPSV